MYMVPQRIPAPSAAQTPCREWAGGPGGEDGTAKSVAPTHIIRAPPTTPTRRRQPAWRSSLKKRKPQRMPRRLLEFHKGKAMLKPLSRMAKIVSVLATAQRHPARSAQMTRWGVRRTSARTDEVPRIRAGRLQRARKTPMTMISEMTIGEMPMETSLVGASAAPSQAPAAKPERMPSSCSFFEREASWIARGNWEEETGGILLRSGNQRINRRRSNPPIKTATGTQKWMSVSTLATQLLPG